MELTSLSDYKGKKVFITGHTGFKGSWLCVALHKFGARLYGYSLEPNTSPALYYEADISSLMEGEMIADIRDYKKLEESIKKFEPEIVIHLAAQPLVLKGYSAPRETFETNVLGTVNLLEAIRHVPSVKSVVNVTTDKVYENKEWNKGYVEGDRLNGYDPYSNSKSCSELVTSSYKLSFFNSMELGVSTARAGNVIGGGDFSENRIIPDCVNSALTGSKIEVRNPFSIRPYQHVIEPILAYLLIGISQLHDVKYCGEYNVGPNEDSCVQTGKLVEIFCSKWGDGLEWIDVSRENVPHEAKYLKLDCTKIKNTFGWNPRWSIDNAVEKTISWTKKWVDGESVLEVMESQIDEYIRG